MNNQEKLIARFLRQESLSKKICKYVLRYAAKGRTGHNVETFEIVEALEGEELDMLAQSIHGRAQTDADGIGPSSGPLRYTVTSVELRGTDDEHESARMTFRVKAAADLDLDGDDEGGEEAPNMRGALSQMMRLNEANNRTMVQMVGALAGSMARREERQSEMIERLLDDRHKMFEEIEQARSQHLEREMTAQAEKRKHDRIDFAVKKAALLAPTVMNYLTDGKMGKDADSPQVLLLKELIGTITPDQMQVLIKVLHPTQQAAFFKLYESLQEKKEEETNGTPVS